MNFIRATLISFLCAVLTFIPVELTKAGAIVQARADSSVANPSGLSISTGTFIAFATSSPTGVNPNGTALTLSNTATAQYFYIRNTGTVALAALSVTFSFTSAPVKLNFARCDLGVNFSATNTCASGTPTTIAAVTGLNTVTLTLPPNSYFAFELDPKKLTTPTVSVSVSSTQLRTAVTTNS